MRGIESTTGSRIYRSDAARMLMYVRMRNAAERGARWTMADGTRALIEANKRLKERVRYLEFDNASLLRRVKEYQRLIAKC